MNDEKKLGIIQNPDAVRAIIEEMLAGFEPATTFDNPELYSTDELVSNMETTLPVDPTDLAIILQAKGYHLIYQGESWKWMMKRK